ncbi:uncharacterized protein [Eleutherodactylus coqui]|uniref:uncharacterized protein n=1 Tax=Eleutherodactylus coqui TaxID=57060 RepID=UPI0034637068
MQQCQPNETLTEEDMQFISLPGDSMKSRKKKNRPMKESKRHKMGDTSQCKMENLRQCHKERQNTSIFNESSSSSQKKKLRRRAAKESGENCPPQEIHNANDFHQTPDHLKLPFKVKENKEIKHQATSQVQSSNRSLSNIELHQPAPENVNGGETQKSFKVEATTDLKCKRTSINDDGISQGRRKHPLSLHQSNIVMYNSTPLSSPTTLPKMKSHTKLNCSGKTKAMNDLSNDSQDLFITQKKCILSHGSSIEDSLPLAQKQGSSSLQDWLRSPDPPQLLSQFSCLARDNLDLSSIRSNQQIVLRETSTQTDDSFTYLTLMSFVKKVKVLEPCSEEALDLSLPSRIRAKKDVLNASDDVIIVESQSTAAASVASRKSKIHFCFSPLQKADTTKFVQTVLNSSYFFKGKGENGESTPIRPLLKIKERCKKKSKKFKKEH